VPPLNRDDSVLYFPPETFGPFRVLHQIGAGTLGPVFRAHEPDRDRLVAIKVFRVDITPEREGLLVQALAALVNAGLRHPGIAAPIGAGVEGNVVYLAQEYAVGDSLDVVLREQRPVPPADALPMVDQLADAIDAAARRGLHHGLLHPRDVLLTAEGPVVTGFGIAQALTQAGVRLPVRRPSINS
jgi:serine/threonine protein kinase